MVSHPLVNQLKVCNSSVPALGDELLTSRLHLVLDRTDADGPSIDSPSLVNSNGVYILFFGSGCNTSTSYQTSYATATNILGPYTRATTPLVQTGTPFAGLVAPGGMDVGPGGVNVVFNADLGTTADTRQMYAGKITITGTEVQWT